MYQKTILKKYVTWNGIYVWCTTLWSIAFGMKFFLTQSSFYVWSTTFRVCFGKEKNFLPGTVSMYGV